MHFFSSREAAEEYLKDRPDLAMLTVEEAYRLAHLGNLLSLNLLTDSSFSFLHDFECTVTSFCMIKATLRGAACGSQSLPAIEATLRLQIASASLLFSHGFEGFVVRNEWVGSQP